MQITSWKDIRDQLAQDIKDGTLTPGDQLPIEPHLAARFGTGRHSVRRAIAALAREGKLRVEQGRGTFVEDAPLIAYTIGKRTRLRQNLQAQGLEASGDLLGFETMQARPRVRKALDLPKGALVYQNRRITYADGVPIATGATYHACDRFADFIRVRDAHRSMTETYAHYGIDDYLRGSTTMIGRLPKPEEAALLQVHKSMPVMVLRAIDTLPDGTPIAFSEVIWAATRVKFQFNTEDI